MDFKCLCEGAKTYRVLEKKKGVVTSVKRYWRVQFLIPAAQIDANEFVALQDAACQVSLNPIQMSLFEKAE